MNRYASLVVILALIVGVCCVWADEITLAKVATPGFTLVDNIAMTKVVAANTVSTPIAEAPLLSGPQPSRSSRLFRDSRQRLAIAQAEGRSEVTLLVVGAPGSAQEILRQVAQLGGEVRYRDDEVGYLRVRLPIERVVEFAEFDRIESIAVDGGVDPKAGSGLRSSLAAEQAGDQSPGATQDLQSNRAALPFEEPWPPTLSDFPLRHPYSPLNDINAAEFLKEHPTYDGRGVTIGLLDYNLDPLLPEFQTAYKLDGRPIPKIADLLNVSDPYDDPVEGSQWVKMREQVFARDHRVTFQGRSFTTPHDGMFRIGFFSYITASELLSKIIERTAKSDGDEGALGVLWDEQNNEVWVDTNCDRSFADEKAMTDYVKRQDVGVFGKDDPATAVRESMGFTIQTDSGNKFVSVNIGLGAHATGVLGMVVANRVPQGRLQGIAPGAQIVSMSYPGGVFNQHAEIEALIAAYKHPQVDLVVLEGRASISEPYRLADAHHPISIIAQRLVRRSNKLLFVPGGNGPGLGLVCEDGLAETAVSVGGYQSQASYRVNAGIVPESVDNMHSDGLSHGPSGIGALKPDLLAPSGQMSLYPGFERGQSIRGLFQLPSGYSVYYGTSSAAPMAAGAAALVVSAAKQSGVPFDAARLKAALIGSARFIPRLAAHEQGNGLVQVGAALELLKKLQSAPTVLITSRAPVRTRLSCLLQTPNVGVGLYEREGWPIGAHGIRTITFTRTTGPGEPMTFTVSWQGNDGTFRSSTSLTLPLEQPVELPVAIAIKEEGPHSAILTLDHPSVPGHVCRVLNTVVAPLRFTAENKYTVNAETVLPRPGDHSVFVEVPTCVKALNFSATATDGTVRIRAISPERETFDTAVQSGVMADPEPGVWEINVSWRGGDFEPNRSQPIRPTRVKITASLAGMELSATQVPITTLRRDGTVDIAAKLTNQFGPASASMASTALAGTFESKQLISAGEQKVFEVIVPRGTTSLRALVSDVADAGSDLDLYLFNCTAERCQLQAKAATVDPNGEVQVLDPTPGRWVIVVDAYDIPSGRTSYSYMDMFTHPRFGSLSTTDVPEKRELGCTWEAAAHAWIASVPEAPRTLQARIVVTSPELRASTGLPVPLGEVDVPLGPSITH